MDQLKPIIDTAIANPIASGLAVVIALMVIYWVFGGIVGRIFRVRNMAAHMLSFLIVAGLAVAVLAKAGQEMVVAEGPLAEETLVVVPRGAGLNETSELLAEAGAIGDPMLFRLAAAYRGDARRLKFGEYRLEPGISIEGILAKLTVGETVSYRVTIAEGLTSWEAVQILNEVEVLTGEIAEVPEEGSLAPNTYFVARGDSRTEVLRRMQVAQQQILDQAWGNRQAALPLAGPNEVLILASIVEKETGVDGERGQVASVFVNRLNRGMPLQSDPTVIYGITKGQGGLGRGLRRSELDRRTDWNTYRIPGLPITPIANPGREAIEAVVNPEQTPFLYFVADGTGGHAFSRTLEEHNRNVAVWRRIERERREAASGQ